jgi:AraC-like DNA-binding protein
MLALLCQDHEAEFAEFSGKLPVMGRDSSHMRRISNFISENYTRGPSIKEAANAARLSKSRLCALIRQYTGTTFQKLIREMRIDEARERLVLTDDTITQVAYAVGYNDDKYFLRAFKKSVGMTPSAYRLKRAKSAAAGKPTVRRESNPAKRSMNAGGKAETGAGSTA